MSVLKDWARWILRDDIDGYKSLAYRNFTQSRERWLYEHKKLLSDLHLCELQLSEMHFNNIDSMIKEEAKND